DTRAAAALFALIDDQHAEVTSHAQRLAAALGEASPFAAFDRYARAVHKRLRDRLSADSSDLHASHCVALASLHHDTFGAGLLRTTDALRRHPTSLPLIDLLCAALTQSIDED